MPRRTFYFYANNAEDSEQWVELLKSKVVVSIKWWLHDV